MRRLAVALLLMLGACAQVRATLPPLDRAAIASETARLQRQAIAEATARAALVQRLAWPLLEANVDLCPRREAKLGIQFVDARSLAGLAPGLTERQARALGYGDVASIAVVTAGSPAALAALAPGDRISRIDDKPAPATADALSRALRKASADKPVTLAIVRADGSSAAVTVTARTLCAFPARLAGLDAINASTNGRTLAINAGLLRAFGDDETLIQIVIGHELAHAVLRHPQRALTTSLLTGGALLGTVAGAAGWVADQAGGLTGLRPPVSYQRQGAALATWPYGRNLEREADYVGLYLAARAGVDLGRAEAVFERFANAHPANTWLSISHPITPERIVAVRAARAQIEARRAAGQPLVPDGLTVYEEAPDADPK